MREKLVLGRYDYAAYAAFTTYALCSLAIPLCIVEMGHSLDFPLDKGGMAAGGVLHMVRSTAMVVSLLVCGLLTGRMGKRRTMGFAVALMGTGVFFCSCSPCYFLLFPFLIFAGFGEGLCEGAATPFVESLHKDAPERYVNMAHGMWSVGIALCVLIAGTLLTLGVHWRIVLGCCGVLALLSSLMFLWKEKSGKVYPENAQKENASKIWQYTVEIAKCPRFWVYCLGMFMGAGAEFCLTFWSAAYLRLNYQASALLGGLGTGAIAAGMFAGRMSFGYFARQEVLKYQLLFCALGTIPLTLLLVFLRPEMFPSMTVMFVVLLVILFFCGIGIAPYWPTLQVYGAQHLPELDSTMLYIYFSAVGIPGCGFFTWIMGVLGDHFGLRGAFLLIPGSVAVYALIVFLEGWIFPRKDLPSEQ